VRIAQVAPLFESVPPKFYGGTERVVHTLTEELVREGHEVTLFASGDSQTSAKLLAPRPIAIRLDKECHDKLANHVLMVEMVEQRSSNFDVVHYHIDGLHFPTARRSTVPSVTTLHGRQDHKELADLYREYSDIPLVSISNDQRGPLPWVNWQATVYHGLPKENFRFNARPQNYLAFLGRISREKRVDAAIEIAKKVGIPLKIAAKVDQADEDYFSSVIRPLLDHPLVEYIGEIGEDAKSEFLGNALALLFPIDWPEPFGLVMIEAMACGTPVLAFRRGSVPEVIDEGVTGFIVDNVSEAVRALRRLPSINRRTCRATFERRFDASRMAADYVAVYERLIESAAVGIGERNGRRHSA
jgi:glycosyltransferase involved in cell wall biosynthesis